jgi:hypothetical protein
VSSLCAELERQSRFSISIRVWDGNKENKELNLISVQWSLDQASNCQGS